MRPADIIPTLTSPDPLSNGMAQMRAARPDHQQAVYWFGIAADAGNAEGLAMLAFCQLEGLGLPRNATQARERLERAAAQGNLTAKFHLARALVAGWGGAIEPARGLALYTDAASQGHADATFNLACCLESGWGCQIDTLAAKALFMRARALGSPLKSPGLLIHQREVDAVRDLARRFERGGRLAQRLRERQIEIELVNNLMQHPRRKRHRSAFMQRLAKVGAFMSAVVSAATGTLADMFGRRGRRPLAHDAGPTTIH